MFELDPGVFNKTLVVVLTTSVACFRNHYYSSTLKTSLSLYSFKSHRFLQSENWYMHLIPNLILFNNRFSNSPSLFNYRFPLLNISVFQWKQTMNSGDGYAVEVTGLSPNATDKDVSEFFAFSGAIQHLEIIR